MNPSEVDEIYHLIRKHGIGLTFSIEKAVREDPKYAAELLRRLRRLDGEAG